MKKIIVIGLLSTLLLGGFIAYQQYNKPHADMSTVKIDAQLSSAALFKAYDADERKANEQYLGKNIQVKGKINNINKSGGRIESLTLETGDMMTGVTCLLDEVDVNHRQNFKNGEEVTLNCVCTGKLMDIELNRCVEVIK